MISRKLVSVLVWVPLSTLPAQQISAIRNDSKELEALVEQRDQTRPGPSTQTRGKAGRLAARARWEAEGDFLSAQAKLWANASKTSASVAKLVSDLRDHPDAFKVEAQLRTRRIEVAQQVERLLALTAPTKGKNSSPTDVAELRSSTIALGLLDQELAAIATQQKSEREERGRLEKAARQAIEVSAMAGVQRDRLIWGNRVTADAAAYSGGNSYEQGADSGHAWKQILLVVGVGAVVAAGVVLKDSKR